MYWVRAYGWELTGEKKGNWLLSTCYNRTRQTAHQKYPEEARPRGYFKDWSKIAAFLLLISITYDSLPQHSLQINYDSEPENMGKVTHLVRILFCTDKLLHLTIQQCMALRQYAIIIWKILNLKKKTVFQFPWMSVYSSVKDGIELGRNMNSGRSVKTLIPLCISGLQHIILHICGSLQLFFHCVIKEFCPVNKATV